MALQASYLVSEEVFVGPKDHTTSSKGRCVDVVEV